MPHEVALDPIVVVIADHLLDDPEDDVPDRLEFVVEGRPLAEPRLASGATEQPLGMLPLDRRQAGLGFGEVARRAPAVVRVVHAQRPEDLHVLAPSPGGHRRQRIGAGGRERGAEVARVAAVVVVDQPPTTGSGGGAGGGNDGNCHGVGDPASSSGIDDGGSPACVRVVARRPATPPGWPGPHPSQSSVENRRGAHRSASIARREPRGFRHTPAPPRCGRGRCRWWRAR